MEQEAYFYVMYFCSLGKSCFSIDKLWLNS